MLIAIIAVSAVTVFATVAALGAHFKCNLLLLRVEKLETRNDKFVIHVQEVSRQYAELAAKYESEIAEGLREKRRAGGNAIRVRTVEEIRKARRKPDEEIDE
jgi:hypothetical protein